jgi:hypothetical protein
MKAKDQEDMTMTFFSTHMMAALCALVLSATMVVGAVGPAAFDGAAASQTTHEAALGTIA